MSSKLALIFKTSTPDIYDFKKSADSGDLASTYIWYLIDTCESIMIVVPEGFQVNPDPNSPFQDLVNPGFELNEMVALPDEKVLIKEISFI